MIEQVKQSAFRRISLADYIRETGRVPYTAPRRTPSEQEAGTRRLDDMIIAFQSGWPR